MTPLKYQRPYKLLTELVDIFESELLPALQDEFIVAQGIQVTDQMIADYENGILASAVDGQMDEGKHEPIPAGNWKQARIRKSAADNDGYLVDISQSSMTCRYGTSKGDSGFHFWNQIRIMNSELQKLEAIELKQAIQVPNSQAVKEFEIDKTREQAIDMLIVEVVEFLLKEKNGTFPKSMEVWKRLKQYAGEGLIDRFEETKEEETMYWVSPYGNGDQIRRSSFPNKMTNIKKKHFSFINSSPD
jgi:hypothetical protein